MKTSTSLNTFREDAASLLVAGCLCLTLAQAEAQTATQPAPVFPVSAVIAQVKRELAAAQNAPGAGLNLTLEKVETTLAVSRVVDASGNVSVGVPAMAAQVGGSGSRKAEDSSTLYVELAPPKPGASLGAVEPKNLGLTEAIVDTRRELLKGLADEPRLDPRRVVITIKFTVTQTLAATGQLKLVVLSVGGGGSLASSDVSTVMLTFAARAPR